MQPQHSLVLLATIVPRAATLAGVARLVPTKIELDRLLVSPALLDTTVMVPLLILRSVLEVISA